MRTIGLIGGCGAESTSLYYSGINRGVWEQRPGHGAKVLLWSFDVEEIDALCRVGDWATAGERFTEAGLWLQKGGADAILICTNSMHRIAETVSASLSAPLIHIIDVTSAAIEAAGCRTPLLLGTRYTMRETFYRERLAKAGLEVRVPSESNQDQLHALIYDELMAGVVSEDGRELLLEVSRAAIDAGADSVILACTELGLAMKAGDIAQPVFDTASLHIAAAVRFSLSQASA